MLSLRRWRLNNNKKFIHSFIPDGQGQAGDGEQRGEVDGGENREDTFFQNLSEHFSAQARRK